MEFDKTDKLFLGSLFVIYLSVILYVAILLPERLISCLTSTVIGLVGGFIGGWIAS